MAVYELIETRFRLKAIILKSDYCSFEHELEFMYFLDDEYPELYILTRLTSETQGFFARLRHAVKYVFGYKSRYGAFDEVDLGTKDAERLISFLRDFLKQAEK